jgi:hypothetical protein
VIATVAAVAGIWTAAAIPAGVLIGRRLRHLEDQTMPDQPDTVTVSVDRITVQRKDSGWTLPFLSPDVQECTTNHIPDYDGPACTDTAVWKVARVHPGLRASIGFWCDTHLPAEHRPADEQPTAADTSWIRAYTEEIEDWKQRSVRAEAEREGVKRVGPTLPIPAERYADEQAVAALASEQQDATSAVDACRLVEVDGEPVRVRGSGDLTAEDHAALAEIIAAARRKHAAEHPEAVDGPAWAQQCSCGGQGIMHLHAEHHEPIGPVAVDPFAGRACPLCGDYVTGLCLACAPVTVAAIARVRDRCQQVRDRVGPGGMINASQILGLLSRTWPDGNAAAVPDRP